jgi:hypothetical protein
LFCAVNKRKVLFGKKEKKEKKEKKKKNRDLFPFHVIQVNFD